MVAAVADFAPAIIDNQKIKRTSANYLLELRPNPDIAASLGKIKRNDYCKYRIVNLVNAR